MARKKGFKIKVGPYNISVQFDSQRLAMRERDLATSSAYGEYIKDQQLILIRDDMEVDYEKDTVVHEIEHVIFDVAGFTDESLKGADEEEIVRRISTVRTQFFLDPINSDFWEYIHT